MTNSVVIKDVDGEKINLEESVSNGFLIILVGFSVAVAVMFFFALAVPMRSVGYVTIVPLGIFAISVIFSWRLRYPIYRVYSVSSNFEIPKTTQHEDQKAICKAVREIECKIREAQRERRELEEIAAGCK